MPWHLQLPLLLHRPVGISLVNGQGVSGVLCSYDHANIYVMEYLYQTQFATKHYAYHEIQNISPFPSCHGNQPGPLY